jgi:CRP-like cAMP-binding protein
VVSIFAGTSLVSEAANEILAALPAKEAAVLNERLKPIELKHGDLLGEMGRPIEQVIFPTRGLISVVAELSTGERIETALVGHKGVLGASIVFGGKCHISTSFVQMPGSALSMRAAEFAELVRPLEQARLVLFKHEQFLLAQAQQSTACNARHQISARLATWLLRARDSADTTTLQLTQEFLAQMLGVQRASVSLVAAQLREAGLIEYRRGKIEIVNEQKLGEAACECSHAVRVHYGRLLGDN